MKRSFDLLGATLGLALITPILPILYIAIKLDSPGPFLVRLERVSAGRVVRIFKFRSMHRNAHEMRMLLMNRNERTDGPFFKIRHDPRVTRVGRIIRKFRVDEFPQLLNVLTGELSLVGPRPHEAQEVVCYPGKYQHILLAKAGVTGLSQVNGASSLPFLQELKWDAHYVKHNSLLMDTKIILKTAKILFSDPTAV